ncbi:MAG: hypothetical protein V3V16_10680 [Melioribacteraceae bacterium]
MYKILLFIFITLFSANIFAQSETKIMSKERFSFLTDSLSTKKNNLLNEKEKLLVEIDSLKNYIAELEPKLKSSRGKQLVRKYGKKIGGRIASGKVWKGMTEKMLKDSWGKPDRVTKNKEKWGTFTQWYYGTITYFFKNGKMTDWEELK